MKVFDFDPTIFLLSKFSAIACNHSPMQWVCTTLPLKAPFRKQRKKKKEERAKNSIHAHVSSEYITVKEYFLLPWKTLIGPVREYFIYTLLFL